MLGMSWIEPSKRERKGNYAVGAVYKKGPEKPPKAPKVPKHMFMWVSLSNLRCLWLLTRCWLFSQEHQFFPPIVKELHKREVAAWKVHPLLLLHVESILIDYNH